MAPPLPFQERFNGPPPSSLYIDPDTDIRVGIWNSLTNAQVRVSARILLPDGRPQLISESIIPPTGRTRFSRRIELSEGFLLSLTALVSGVDAQRGQVFVNVSLVQSRGATLTRTAVLISDYLTSGPRLSWPGGQWRNMVEGPGAILSITGTDPVAGAEISETIPANTIRRLKGIRFILVTAAGGAARVVRLFINDGAADLFRFTETTTQAPTTTIFHQFTPSGSPETFSVTTVHFPIPDILLRAGWVISTNTLNLAAGDNYGAPFMYFEEWIQE